MKYQSTHRVVLAPLPRLLAVLIVLPFANLVGQVVAELTATVIEPLAAPYDEDWRRGILYSLYKAGWHPSDAEFEIAMSSLALLPHAVYAVAGGAVLIGAYRLLRLIRLPYHWIPREGRCSTCGYDLTGNVSGVCPECGTPFALR